MNSMEDKSDNARACGCSTCACGGAKRDIIDNSAKPSTPKYIYIAGPYTIGDVGRNVANAVDVMHYLLDFGFIPYCPHLAHLAHLLNYRSYEDWLGLGMAWIKRCDALLRIEGESRGADAEVEFAESLGIPIYYDLSALVIQASWPKPLQYQMSI